MQGHHIDAQRLAGIDHILRIRPQRRARTLPGVAAIKQKCAGTTGLHALDQRRKVRKATDLAVSLGGFLEIQIGVGVRLKGIGFETEMFEQVFANQVRNLAELIAKAKIDVGLAKIDRQQLGMAVGNVQQTDIAKFWQVIQFGRTLFGQRDITVQTHATRCGNGHDPAGTPDDSCSFQFLKKSPSGMPDGAKSNAQSLLTGDSGSTRKATMWVICSGVSQPCKPKRGMLVQAVKAFELYILS